MNLKTSILLTSFIVAALAIPANASKLDSNGSTQFQRCMKQSGGDTPAMKDCGADEIDRQNKILDATYKAIKARLKVRLQSDLIKSQRAWLKFREEECAIAYDTQSPASLAAIMYQSCEIQMTVKRISDLDTIDESTFP